MSSILQKEPSHSSMNLLMKYPSIYTLIFLCFFGWNYSFAQIDSLEKLLPTLPDNTQKVDVLNKLSYLYHNNDIQQTFAYANEAFALTNSLKYTKGRATAFHTLSIANSISGDITQATEFNDQAIHLADSIKAYRLLAGTYIAKGILQDKADNPEIAIQFFQKSFDLAEQEDFPNGIISACFNLGNVYSDLEQFDKARNSYKRAIITGESLQAENEVAWGNRCIARSYYDEKNYLKAESYFEKALKLSRAIKDKRSLSFTLSEFASNHLKLGKRELAEQYMQESIELIRAVGDTEGEIIGLQDLAQLYIETDRPNKAIEISNQALVINKKNKSSFFKIQLLEIISSAYAQKQAFKTAYEIEQLVKSEKDSLDYTSKLELTAELEQKYQTQKKETENTLLRTEQIHQSAVIAKQKTINFILMIVALLLALLGYVAFSAYRNKQRNNLLLEEKVAARTLELQTINTQLIKSNEELSRFAYVASHDLREPLRNITNFTHLLQKSLRSTAEGEVLQFMDIIQKNTTHMNNLIIDTLEFTKLSNKEVKKSQVNINHILKNIKSSIATRLENRNATINILQPLPVIQTNEGLLFSVFKNLIENGITYNENSAPIININHAIRGDHYLFSMNDNGIGIPKEYRETIFIMFKRLQNREKYEGSGMGLANCRKIINKLGGKIWVESDGQNGSTFFFTIPKTNAQKASLPFKKISAKDFPASVEKAKNMN